MKPSLIALFICIHITAYAMEHSTGKKSKSQQEKPKPSLVLLFLKVSPAENRFLFFPVTDQTRLREVIERLHSHFVPNIPVDDMNYIITPVDTHKSVKACTVKPFNLERWGSKKIIPIMKLCKSEMFSVGRLDYTNPVKPAPTSKQLPKMPLLDLSKISDKDKKIGKR